MDGSESSMKLVLGIDIGTTTVKASVVRADTREVLQTKTRETKARLPNDLDPLASEQDVHKIATALQFCVSQLEKTHMRHVVTIAISGQMHGVVLWKQGEGWRQNNFGRYEIDNVSVLYTWQDGRCTPEFLASLPQPRSPARPATGHGVCTLLWLARNRPAAEMEAYDRAGTVQDLVVAMLCGLSSPVMSLHNAVSWGYFDPAVMAWNTDLLEGVDPQFLPSVVPAGELAGKTQSPWYEIPAGTPVLAAMGDLQCFVKCSLESESDAALNISTSAQISYLQPEGYVPPSSPPEPSEPIDVVPYFGGRYLAVAASLNGGNVVAAFVRMVQQWTHEFGMAVPESKIWDRILACNTPDDESDLEIIPTLYGERHAPGERARAWAISPLTLTFGRVARALCRGVVRNLGGMLPRERLREAGVTRVVGSGMALLRNPVLRLEVEALLEGLPVQYVEGRDSSVGAALAALDYSSVP